MPVIKTLNAIRVGPKVLNYPDDCNTNSDKREWCFPRWKALFAAHNAKGADFKAGRISEQYFREYQIDWFKQYQAVMGEINRIKEAGNEFALDPERDRAVIISIQESDAILKGSTRWPVQLSRDITD